MTDEDRQALATLGTTIDTRFNGVERQLGVLQTDVNGLNIRVLGDGDIENSIIGRLGLAVKKIEIVEQICAEYIRGPIKRRRNLWLIMKDIVLILMVIVTFAWGSGVLSRRSPEIATEVTQ